MMSENFAPNMENNQQSEENIATGSAPDTDPEPRHKLENLKMTQVKAAGATDQPESSQSANDWTVVYSDSNSSVLSGVDDDDEDQTIDISVVDEEIKTDNDENDEDELDDLKEEDPTEETEQFLIYQPEQNVLSVEIPAAMPHLIQFGTMKKLDEISLTDTGSKIQIWEQSADPTEESTSMWKPILVKAVDDDEEDTPPSPSPSFADNEYESSDIDIINDDDDELNPGLNDDRDSIMSLSISSIVSQSSNLSRLREQYLQAHLSKQANRRSFAFKYFSPKESAASDDESSPSQSIDTIPVPKSGRIRAYVHTPNTGLNGKLNLILILTVATVVGLGIGHFLGWSNQWRQQNQLSMGQVIKLKHLQDDLLVCMKNQDWVHNTDTGSVQYVQDRYKVCLHDSDYWKQRFETLFNENKGLIEVFQKTQKHFIENGHHENVIDEHKCENKTTSEEFHKLKLDLLVNQMEHLKLLEVFAEVKTKGQQSEKLLKVLEEENEDLKKKLVEEEEDDQEIEESWGNRVAVLQTENEELRKTIVEDDVEDMKVLGSLRQKMDSVEQQNRELRQIIDRLEEQIGGVVVDGKWKSRRHSEHYDDYPQSKDTSFSARYNLLRDRINQMMSENEELKAKIARYRWTSESRQKQENFEQQDNEEQNGKFSRDSKDRTNYDSTDQRKLEVLKAKIGVLNHKLEIEQNESRRWKEKFESALKKMKRMNDKEKRTSAKEEKDGDSPSDDSDSEGETYEETNDQRKQKTHTKWDSFHSKWHRKFESISDRSRKFFSSFYDKVRSKWNKLHKKYSAEFEGGEPLSGDRLIKIGQFLENAIENVHNFSESLFHKGMRSEVVTYLSDRMSDFASMLEKNLHLNTQQTENNQEVPQKQEAESDQHYEQQEWQHHEPDEDRYHDDPNSNLWMHFGKEPEADSDPSSDPTAPPYPSLKKKRDWFADRAKAREKHRRLQHYQSNHVN